MIFKKNPEKECMIVAIFLVKISKVDFLIVSALYYLIDSCMVSLRYMI